MTRLGLLRRPIACVSALLALVVAACSPSASPEAFCATADEYVQRLNENTAGSSGGALDSLVTVVENVGLIEQMLRELIDVSPDDVRADVETAHDAFASIVDKSGDAASDPGGAILGGLFTSIAAGPAFERIDSYAAANCGAPIFGPQPIAAADADGTTETEGTSGGSTAIPSLPKDDEGRIVIDPSSFGGGDDCRVTFASLDLGTILCRDKAIGFSLSSATPTWTHSLDGESNAWYRATENTDWQQNSEADLLATIEAVLIPAQGLTKEQRTHQLVVLGLSDGNLFSETVIVPPPQAVDATDLWQVFLLGVTPEGTVVVHHQFDDRLALVEGYRSDGSRIWARDGVESAWWDDGLVSFQLEVESWRGARDIADPNTGQSVLANEYSLEDRGGLEIQRSACSPYAVIHAEGDDRIGLLTPNGVVLGNQSIKELAGETGSWSVSSWVLHSGVLLHGRGDYVFANEEGAIWSIPADVVQRVEVIGGNLWVTNPSLQVVQVDLATGSEESFPTVEPPIGSPAFWPVNSGFVSGILRWPTNVVAVTPTLFDWGCSPVLDTDHPTTSISGSENVIADVDPVASATALWNQYNAIWSGERYSTMHDAYLAQWDIATPDWRGDDPDKYADTCIANWDVDVTSWDPGEDFSAEVTLDLSTVREAPADWSPFSGPWTPEEGDRVYEVHATSVNHYSDYEDSQTESLIHFVIAADGTPFAILWCGDL